MKDRSTNGTICCSIWRIYPSTIVECQSCTANLCKTDLFFYTIASSSGWTILQNRILMIISTPKHKQRWLDLLYVLLHDFVLDCWENRMLGNNLSWINLLVILWKNMNVNIISSYNRWRFLKLLINISFVVLELSLFLVYASDSIKIDWSIDFR